MRFIYNIVKSKEAAEDLTQEVFLSAYKKLYTFNKEYRFSTWLYQIAKNKCIDHMRKHGKARETSIENITFHSQEILPEEFVQYKETKETIERFIKTLKDTDRKILILRYSGEHLTFRDIGELLNMNEATVKKRYYKIYDNFEKYVEGSAEKSTFFNIARNL
jgi:RNA polymerase sigma-70 factor (ECF subfamily)